MEQGLWTKLVLKAFQGFLTPISSFLSIWGGLSRAYAVQVNGRRGGERGRGLGFCPASPVPECWEGRGVTAWRKGPFFLICPKVPYWPAGASSERGSSSTNLTVLGSRASDSLLSLHKRTLPSPQRNLQLWL